MSLYRNERKNHRRRRLGGCTYAYLTKEGQGVTEGRRKKFSFCIATIG